MKKVDKTKQLNKDPGQREVPGFTKRSNVPTAQARSYASWNRKIGPDGRSTPIPLPDEK